MSWNQLLSIVKNEREQQRILRSKTPTSCPNDSTLLELGPRNTLYCPFDGWVWDGNPESAL